MKIFSCRVTRVDPVSVPLSRLTVRGTRAPRTPHFCCCNTFRPWQTTPRGLPGNCWKHRPSVYSVIEVRWSHLAAYDQLEQPRFLHPGPATVEHLLEGQQTIRKLALTTFFFLSLSLSLLFLFFCASNNYGSM